MRTIRIRAGIDMVMDGRIRGVVVRVGMLVVAGLVPVDGLGILIMAVVRVAIGRVIRILVAGRVMVVLGIRVLALEPALERRLRRRRGVA